jgi:hypothetical protein
MHNEVTHAELYDNSPATIALQRKRYLRHEVARLNVFAMQCVT